MERARKMERNLSVNITRGERERKNGNRWENREKKSLQSSCHEGRVSRQRRQIGRQHESLVYPDTGEVGICCHPLPAAGMASAVQDIGHSEGSCWSSAEH